MYVYDSLEACYSNNYNNQIDDIGSDDFNIDDNINKIIVVLNYMM